MAETTFTQKVTALPAWKVIWEMLTYRPWLWFVDLISVALIRFCWQIAPALIIKAFFDMVTGAAQLTFGIWAIVAFFAATWIGRIIASYGFYYADVPIFADMNTLLRKNLLRYILKRPGASQLPDSPGEAVSRFKKDVDEIPLFVILINDVMVGLVIIAHRLNTIHRADEIMILDKGTVSEYGDRRQLAADPNSRFYQLLQTGMEEVLA